MSWRKQYKAAMANALFRVSDEIYYWYSNGKRYAGGLYKDKSGTMILMPFLRIE
jgi:hypothetical protein